MTPWTLELWDDGAGTTTRVEDTTKEMVSMHSTSKVKARAKAKETVTIVDHQGITQESAPTRKSAKAKARDSKENVPIAARRVIPQGSAPKAKKEESQKEKETVTKEKAKDRGVGEREFGK